MADVHTDHGAPRLPINAALLLLAYVSTIGALGALLMLFLPAPPLPVSLLPLLAAGAFGGALLFWTLYLGLKEGG
jgi:uncharacterized membrane protein YdjX (TVP38/TMEM64 family)